MTREFQRAIFFTKVPLGGYYKYRDVFQIFPADLENLPRSSMQRHYPNIIEFWISEKDKEEAPLPDELESLKKLLTPINASLKKQDEILGLLSTFTNNLFFRYTDTEGAWGYPMHKDDPGEEANTWSSMWCLKWFHFPDLPRQLKIDNFTTPTIPEIQKKAHKEFYMFFPNLDYDRDTNIELPETIDELFDAYFSLDPTKTVFVDSAVAYTVSAVELMNTKKTLSLLASFTSVETMVNLEFKDLAVHQCETCGQPRYSVAKKFREYLVRYVATSDQAKKKFNSYYTLRSKIVHTGRRLKAESLFANVPRDEHEAEVITRTEILQIGKLAIVNWLLMHEEVATQKTEITASEEKKGSR
jgi:hypothetical protein